jgi:opacity protein-like surface antigen
MKFRNALVLGIVLLFAIPAFAQDDQGKFELSGNFSYVHWNPAKNYSNSVNLFGGGASIAYFLTQSIGIKGEFLGYGSQNNYINVPTAEGNSVIVASGNLVTYMFGPVIKKRSGTFQPYANILLGGAHSSLFANLATAEHGTLGASPSGNAFAMAAGGGLDIKVSHSISLRAAEVDYLLTRFNAFNGQTVAPPFFSTHNQNNFRLVTGIVFSF